MTTEILAPAGDEESAYAAINAGADAVYLGMSAFSARSSAKNFGEEALKKLIASAHVLGVKVYVALNTLVKDGELGEFIRSAVTAHNLGADALILQDIYLGAYLKKNYPQMCLHLSTQAGVCNVYGAKYAKELGFSRVILARETKLADIAEIASVIETEAFVQGALCTCFSGQCYLSSFAGGNSGNRGKCKQPCRKQYKIDRSGFDDYSYRISLADLSVGQDISALVKAGVTSFKIEGRMRRAEYVSAAVSYYKNVFAGESRECGLSELKRTYNRGNYTKGLAFGQDKTFISSAVQGHIGEYIGVISVADGKYICKSNAHCGEGDGFKILRGGKELCGAAYLSQTKGGFYIKSNVRLKNGDKVFITTDAALNSRLLQKKRVKTVKLSARFYAGETPSVTVDGREYIAGFKAEEAHGRPLTAQDVITCFSKTDTLPLEVEFTDISVGYNVFVPASFLNAFRREVYAKYVRDCANGAEMIEKCEQLPVYQTHGKNTKTAIIATDLNGISADIGILKPNDYNADFLPYIKAFGGEKFIYLPPYMSGAELEAVKGRLKAFDGIYCGGNYAVPLAKELNLKLFAGVGFNLFNAVSANMCPADYYAVSKELTVEEARSLCGENAFYLTAGDIKVMDLIYCPFGKSCAGCDKRDIYTLTDGDGRAFPMRRYVAGECRFELFNCAKLSARHGGLGALYDFTTFSDPAEVSAVCGGAEKLKNIIEKRTKGHSETPVN